MWPLVGARGRGGKSNTNNGYVLTCGLLIDISGRSDYTASVVVIAKIAGDVFDGLTFSKFAPFGWMG